VGDPIIVQGASFRVKLDSTEFGLGAISGVSHKWRLAIGETTPLYVEQHSPKLGRTQEPLGLSASTRP
jgi:hypothetical protein